MKKNKGLYIHIPFCEEICPYCAFSHFLASTNKQDLYIDRLVDDIKKYQHESFSSIYIGGGTPSVLSIDQLEKLFIALKPLISIDTSFTIEANPTSLDLDKIKLFKKYSINRVSIGIETFQKKLQQELKRFTTYEEIKKIISQLNEVGINDINIDLMFGINNEDLTMLKDDLDLFTSLNITHISCYCLQVEEHTVFYNQHKQEMNQDDAAEQYDFICDYLKEKGFIHYEISNFAKEGYKSKHNLIYWRNEEYVGLGISSAGFEKNIRYVNENSLSRYINKTSTREEEILNEEDDEKYYIILNLRLSTGINFKEYKKLYHKDFNKVYEEQLIKLKELDYIDYNEEGFSIKEKYFFILNTILLYFL